MRYHLPECFSNKLSGDSRHCICIELRSCEERVLDAAQEAIETAFWDALETLDPLDPQTITIALNAIDALREKP